MSKKKINRRLRVKPFVKHVNLTHVMPTRYSVSDLEIKSFVSEDSIATPDGKKEAKKSIRLELEQRYRQPKKATSEKNAAGAAYFFKKLHF